MDRRIFTAEFIGTFTLIFIGAGAGAIGAGGLVGVALAHGLVIVGAAYAFGAISGAHVNPAVTLAMVAAKELELKSAITYWLAQFLGGAAGAWGLFFVLGPESSLGATEFAADVSLTQGIFVEMILTFFLVNAIFQTAVKGRGGDHAGLVIGLTLVFAILMGGPLTGASLNPARTFGPALFTGGLGIFWVYLLGTGLGGLLAAWLYKWLD